MLTSICESTCFVTARLLLAYRSCLLQEAFLCICLSLMHSTCSPPLRTTLLDFCLADSTYPRTLPVWYGNFVLVVWRERIVGLVLHGFLGGSESKESACNAGDLGSIPGTGKSPGERNDNPLQYSWMENCMERGATVHAVAKSWTWLSDWHTHTHAHAHTHVRAHTHTHTSLMFGTQQAVRKCLLQELNSK